MQNLPLDLPNPAAIDANIESPGIPSDVQRLAAEIQKSEPQKVPSPTEVQNLAENLENLPDALDLPADIQNLAADIQNSPKDTQNSPADIQKSPIGAQSSPPELPIDVGKVAEGLDDIPIELPTSASGIVARSRGLVTDIADAVENLPVVQSIQAPKTQFEEILGYILGFIVIWIFSSLFIR